MRTLWCLFAIGCSSTPALKPSVPPVAGAPAIDAIPPHAAPDEVQPTTAIAPECRGANVDLRAIANTPACHIGADGQPLPPSITVRIDPKPVRVASGGQAKAALVLTNSTNSEVELRLADSCDGLTKLAVEMRDAKGERVDAVGGECGTLEGCGAESIGLVLAAHGVARLDFDVDARKLTYDKDCHDSRVGRVAAGSYALVVTNFTFGELRSTVKVR